MGKLTLTPKILADRAPQFTKKTSKDSKNDPKGSF
jgi:hypothetical protein